MCLITNKKRATRATVSLYYEGGDELIVSNQIIVKRKIKI